MSATIDGARIAHHLGDAPVIASEGRAFPVETRYVGRDPKAPIDAQVADATVRALRAERRLDPGVPARHRARSAAPRRGSRSASATPRSTSCRSTARSMRRRRTAPSRLARPGRRKVVLATSIAETSLTIDGVRIVVDSGLARVPVLRAGCRPDPARDRAGVARRRRPAPRPRRPHRAGRLLSAVGRGPDRLARAVPAPGNPHRRSVLAGARPRPMGRRRSRISSPFSIRRPARRSPRQRRCCASSARSTPTAASRRKESSSTACRCRRGSPAWWSIAATRRRRTACGRDRRARHRARARRRRRRSRPPSRRPAPRPLAPGRGGARHGDALGGAGVLVRAASPAIALGGRHPRPRVSGPHRQESRRRQRRLPARQRPRRPGRSGLGARARALSRGRRDHRQRRARPHRAGGARSRLPRSRRALPIASRPGKRSRSTPPSASLRGRRLRRLGAIALAEQPVAVTADEAAAHALAAGIAKARARPPAVDQGADAVARPRAVPAGRAEGEEWPDLSDAGLAARTDDWLVPPLDGKTSLGATRRRRARRGAWRRCCLTRCAAGSTPRRRPISRRRPVRGCRSTTRPRKARSWRSGCRSCSALRGIRPLRAAAFRW